MSSRFAVRERGPNKTPSLRDIWEAVMQNLAGVAEVDIVDLVEGCMHCCLVLGNLTEVASFVRWFHTAP